MLCWTKADDLYYWGNLTEEYMGTLSMRARNVYSTLRGRFPDALVCVGDVVSNTAGYNFIVLSKNKTTSTKDANLIEDADLTGTWVLKEAGVCEGSTFVCLEYISKTKPSDSVSIINTHFVYTALSDLEASVY